MRDFDRYVNHSRLLSVSLVASLPLLALYEIGVLVTGSPVENHVSVLVKRMIGFFGGDAYLILTALTAAGFLFALAAKHRGPGRDFGFYWVMVIEGAIYAAVLGPVIHLVGVRLAAGPAAGEFLNDAILLVGAGVWEELFFRLALLGGFLLLSVRWLGGNPVVFSVLGLLLSSAAFSAIHHLGPLGEPFAARIFLFRFLAGGVLGTLYLLRGLGICVYTHAFYNVGLLLLRSAEM
jgi:hypothetical protein